MRHVVRLGVLLSSIAIIAMVPALDVRLSLFDDIRAGYGLVRASQLFRLVAISSILYSLRLFHSGFSLQQDRI